MSTSARDINILRYARVRVDELIRHSAALQTAILSSAIFAVIATDESGLIQYFNLGAELMMGYARCDVVGRMRPTDIWEIREFDRQAAAPRQTNRDAIDFGSEAQFLKSAQTSEDIYALCYIRKDGTRSPTILSVVPLAADGGEDSGHLFIATDDVTSTDMQEGRLLVERGPELFSPCAA